MFVKSDASRQHLRIIFLHFIDAISNLLAPTHIIFANTTSVELDVACMAHHCAFVVVRAEWIASARLICSATICKSEFVVRHETIIWQLGHGKLPSDFEYRWKIGW